MKLITLNIWGGKVFDPLMKFLEDRAQDTDVFCFQEMMAGDTSVYAETQKRLADFASFFYEAPKEARYFQSEPLAQGVSLGQAIFVRKHFAVSGQGGFRAYEGEIPEDADYGAKITGSCQWIKIDGTLTILNVHGLWQRGTDKADTPERLKQSIIINNFMAAQSGRKILCGDLNLLPNSKSLVMLGEGMKNLVKAFSITSTRSSLYPKPIKFSDYMLVSPEVSVRDFSVLQNEISDHLPLYIDFE